MTWIGVLLFRCSDANTRRQSCGRSTSSLPSVRRAPAVAREPGEACCGSCRRRSRSGARRLGAGRGRAGAARFLVRVPAVAGGHVRGAVEGLDVADDLGDDAAEAVADREHARAVELRRLDVQAGSRRGRRLCRRLRMSSVVSSHASSIRSPDCSSSSSSAQSQKIDPPRPRGAPRRRARRSSAVWASCQRRAASARSLGTSRSRSRIAAAWRLSWRRRAFSKPTPTRSWRSIGTAGGAQLANGEPSSQRPRADVGEKAADVDQPAMRGRAVLAAAPRARRAAACGRARSRRG